MTSQHRACCGTQFDKETKKDRMKTCHFCCSDDELMLPPLVVTRVPNRELQRRRGRIKEDIFNSERDGSQDEQAIADALHFITETFENMQIADPNDETEAIAIEDPPIHIDEDVPIDGTNSPIMPNFNDNGRLISYASKDRAQQPAKIHLVSRVELKEDHYWLVSKVAVYKSKWQINEIGNLDYDLFHILNITWHRDIVAAKLILYKGKIAPQLREKRSEIYYSTIDSHGLTLSVACIKYLAFLLVLLLCIAVIESPL